MEPIKARTGFLDVYNPLLGRGMSDLGYSQCATDEEIKSYNQCATDEEIRRMQMGANNIKDCCIPFNGKSERIDYTAAFKKKDLADSAYGRKETIKMLDDLILAVYASQYLKPKKIVFNDPATIVYWTDGTKTVVKCQEPDVYDKHIGLAYCFVKKALGNKSNFNSVLDKLVKEYS